MLSSTSKGAQRIYDQTQILDVDGKIPKCNILYAGGSETGKEVRGCTVVFAMLLVGAMFFLVDIYY